MTALPALLLRLARGTVSPRGRSLERNSPTSEEGRAAAADAAATSVLDGSWRPSWASAYLVEPPPVRPTRAGRLLAELWSRARPLRQPVVGFGLALIASFWVAAFTLIAQDHEAVRFQMQRDASNLALVFEQNVAHTVGDLDRALLFLRWARANAPPGVEWSDIVSQAFVANRETAQTSVIDANGVMITSSALLHPPTPMDLSDRQHFLTQLHSKEDKLFISLPVVGRASGKWSVQFTRKLTDAQDRFAGVVVISLDAAQLAHNYAELNLGPGGGLALVGDDGIVRAGSGVFADLMAKPLDPGAMEAPASPRRRPPAPIADAAHGFVSVVHPVEGSPLKVVVAIPNEENNERWTVRRHAYLLVAAIASLAALVVTVAVAFRRHRSEARILYLARYDPLTNLPNRRQLSDRLDAMFALAPEDRSYALHIVDLDRFKFVNDTYGHPFGDLLLKRVADRLLALAKPSDLVVRLGGDEFALVQSLWSSRADAKALAERICHGIAEPFDIGAIKVVIGATVGIGSAADDAASASELLKAADLALYAAKSENKGGYRFYDPAMTHAVRERTDLETGLRTAIDRDELQLHYQPIVSLKERRTIGYEALIRWTRPEHGVVSPVDFIPVAEETGLIARIGDWVLRRACADIAALPSPMRVAVNCSPLQFELSDVAESVQAALALSGLPPNRLEIEITESALMKNNHRVLDQLTRLRAIGVRVSMDDFGTGFSSLSYLERFPITTIKIDRSFVQKLGQRDGARATVRAIIELAMSYKMTSLAEGVETAEQLEVLAELGCDHAQGFLFSKPKPIHELGQVRLIAVPVEPQAASG